MNTCFVQDDEFEASGEEFLGRSKIFNLLTHYIDTTIIRCIELQDHRLVAWAVQLTCDG